MRQMCRFCPAVLLMLWTGSPAVAQPAPADPEPAALVLPEANPGHVWVMLDPLGAAFQVPRRTRVVHRPTESAPHLMLRDGSESPAWSVRAEIVEAPPLSASEVAAGSPWNPAKAVILGPEALGSAEQADIIDRRANKVHGRDAQEAWVQQTLSDGPQVVFGWLAIPRTDGQVMLFTGVTTPAKMPLARSAIDSIFESITPTDTPEALAGANAAIDRGLQIMQTIDRHRLESLIGLRRVLRIWRPTSEGGQQEVGFGTLTVSSGTADAIKPDTASPSPASTAEEGLLVTLHLRYAIDPMADKYLDQIARMWMSWDGLQEQWYLNSTRKQRGLQASETELGIRTPPSAGQPRSRLIVIRQDDAGARAPFENAVPRGWLPRPLEWLLADLAPRREGPMAAWAAWDRGSAAPRLLLRRDQWTPNPDGSWTLSTWEGMDAMPSTTLVSRRGPVSTSKPDGTRIDVSTDEAIAARWQAAGLKLR
ncbi:MAG: hypothetical protein MK101_07270 [Phycisphaerales bacterium]|nr:hypothetical protein [Phycisphaerales bacterium]